MRKSRKSRAKRAEPNAPQRTRRALRKYQREALAFAVKHTNTALFMEMRTGKTLTLLRSLAVRFPQAGRILVVGPYSALYQWVIELKKEGYSDNDISMLIGTRKERARNLQKDCKFFLLNKEGWSAVQQIKEVHWQAVILDESTFIKGPKSRVSRFFIDNFRNVDSRWILTGMPAPESALDYYMQLRFLDPTILGAINFWEFRRLYFTQTFRGEYAMTTKGEKFINERLANNCFFLSRADADIEVEKIFTKRPVRLKAAARKIMQTLAREFVLEDDSRVYGVTDNAGAKFATLRRLCGGFVNNIFMFNDKLREVIDLLSGELSQRQVVVYAEYIDEIMMLTKELTNLDISNDYIYGGNRETRFDILDNFRAGRTRVLIGQPVCFKHGVDLSCSDTVIYYSLPMANETFGQSQDRIINVSTRFPGHYLALICENTIEEDIYLAMINKETKEQMQKRIVRRLQEEIKK